MKRIKKSKGGHSVNPSKREEFDYNSYQKGNNDEKNFIAKLQANLGLTPETFKML